MPRPSRAVRCDDPAMRRSSPMSDEPRLTVALTFDHDAISDGVRRGDPPVKLSHAEFGPRVGRAADPRAARARAASRATWFVPGHTLVTFPDEHRRDPRGRPRARLPRLVSTRTAPSSTARRGARRSSAARSRPSRERTGAPPAGYRAPYWALERGDARRSSRRPGFGYDISLMADDYRLLSGPPRRPPSIADGHDLGTRERAGRGARLLGARRLAALRAGRRAATGCRPPSKVLEIWPGELRYAYAHAPGGLLTVTMHPECIGRGHRMAMLEPFIDRGEGAPRRRVRAPGHVRHPLVGRIARPRASCRLRQVSGARRDLLARRRTASNIGGVSVPVNVFCWLGWYEPSRTYGPSAASAR